MREAHHIKGPMSITYSVILCAVFGITVACSASHNERQSSAVKNDASKMTTKQVTTTDQPIRSINFVNFTYPWISDLGDPIE
jgi:hypothetical protein